MAFDWSRTAPRYKFVRFTCSACGESVTTMVSVYRVVHKILFSEVIDNPNKR